MESGILVKGHLKVLKNGVVVDEVENLVVNYGLALMAELLAGNTTVLKPSFVAIGSGDNTPLATDMALETEVARHSAAVELGTGSNANKVSFTYYWPPNAFADTIQEAGLFDAATDGNLFSRVIFTPVVIGTIDTFAIIWTISFNAV